MSMSTVFDESTRFRHTLRRRVLVRGIIQGVGYRPFVYRVATRLGLTGFVQNDTWGVVTEVQGDDHVVEQFLRVLRNESPAAAEIVSRQVIAICPVRDERTFRILASRDDSREHGRLTRDVAICAHCVSDVNNSGNRRYRYPFVSCAECGPRFSILRQTPFDRGHTSMAEFPMCFRCREEYEQPQDRRFHAQTIACGDCGPKMWFVDHEVSAEAAAASSGVVGVDHVLRAFFRAMNQGQIVAVKGIGGFHLMCDARSSAAVSRLRARKDRGDKPFAVMVRDVEQAKQFAHFDECEVGALSSPAAPIVLVRSRAETTIAAEVAPHNPWLGLMLPYSPLHWLLLEGGPLVATSGNLAGEPLAYENDEAIRRLAGVVDAFLLHDREIVAPIDDGVTRWSHGRELPVRRSRGHAPMTVDHACFTGSGLAIGGEVKGTICMVAPGCAYVSQHVGDWGYVGGATTVERTIRHLARLTRIEPQFVACDLHPDYHSTRFAESYAQERALPLIRVQHHHAHLAALLAEHGIDVQQQVIGFVFDGTGYGDDDAIWGGEVLLGSIGEYRRAAHLRYLPLPGGDAAIRCPKRIALAALSACGLPWDPRLPSVAATEDGQQRILKQQLQSNINTPLTSSMGRLFDAAASLIGVRQIATYEAQAAIELEGLADAFGNIRDDCAGYGFAIQDLENGGPIQIDPTPLLAATCQDVYAGVDPARMSAKFHRAVADLIENMSVRLRDETAIHTVGLTGGVFQNAVLLTDATRRLESLGFQTLTHRQVPANDGGLALGQAAVSLARRVI